jgi:ATP-dependent Clp protease ATP-binding subunit ClpX
VSTTSRKNTTRCSFCGRDSREVGRLIAGPDGVHICDQCIRLCRSIVTEGRAPDGDEAGSFDRMRPSAIKRYLDEHVIGQDRAKKVLSVAVYSHFKRLRDLDARTDDVELSKGNILMIGPTGSGKTLLARTLARRLGVPFTMADATSLTEAGYVGEDVESIVKNLWLQAGRDVDLASRGIVCIDEVDKIARSSGTRGSAVRDVGGEGVQQALLKVIESQNVMIPPDGNRGRPQQELVTIDTSNVLFICCGAFSGIEEIVERRVAQPRIGFNAEPVRRGDAAERRRALMKQVRSEDLQKFGLIPEFVGRLPVIVTLDELETDDLVEVLWKPRNALVRQYMRLFELEGVKLRFHHEALLAVVAEARKRGAGARGLRAILESVMLDVMFELPSMDDVRECVITEASVLRHEKPILVRRRHPAPRATPGAA